MVETNTPISNRVDELESVLLNTFPKANCPVTHKFLPGMYVRCIFMPAGSVVTSLIHKTTHPYFILQGMVTVFSETHGEEILQSPYIGITTPGTRRVITVLEDTVWATVHLTDIQPENDSEEAIEAAVEKIGSVIIEPHVNPYLGGRVKNNIITSNLIQDEA